MSPKLDNIIMDPSNDKFKDECGVFGVYSNKPLDVASVAYYGLYALQHRGQESAGIAVANGESNCFTLKNSECLKPLQALFPQRKVL